MTLSLSPHSTIFQAQSCLSTTERSSIDDLPRTITDAEEDQDSLSKLVSDKRAVCYNSTARLSCSVPTYFSMATTSSPFTDLVKELKDMVFHELWIEHSHLVLALASLQYPAPDNSLMQILLDYDEPHPQHRYKEGLPKWLLTSKATYDKGLKQMLSKAILSWPAHLHLGTRPKKMPCLDIHAAEAFTFRFDFYKWSPRIHPLHPHLWIGKHIRHVAQRLNAGIKTVNFALKYPFSEYLHPGQWEFRLPILNAQLDKLEEINFRLEISRLNVFEMSRSGHIVEALLVAAASFKRSLNFRGIVVSSARYDNKAQFDRTKYVFVVKLKV
jgi:hypothetical protein